MSYEYRVKLTEVESEFGALAAVRWELQRLQGPPEGFDDPPTWEWASEDVSTTKQEALKAAQHAKAYFDRQDKLEEESEFIALD